MQDNKEERFPIVDEQGQVVGSATRGECHNGSRLLHPVVHLHVFNSRGELYLQKRPEWKDIQPGKWDTSVGGHMDYGETPEQALTREVREELGIVDFVPERVGQYVFDSRRERELVYVNKTVYDGPVCPSADELDGGRFWTIDEIRDAIGNDILTPNFESEFQRFFLTNNNNMNITEQDKQYMREAIRLANESVERGGGPFGAIIVKDGEIIAGSSNSVTIDNDPTAHAEVNTIRQACKKLGTFDLTGSTIYTSCEPCPMCLGAIYWARISRIFYGNTRKDARDIQFADDFIYEELDRPLEARTVPILPLLRDEALQSFRKWSEKSDKTEY